MENRIFVFGSNISGRHGKGAALHAKLKHGACTGVGEGMTGTSYAIPTKDAKLNVRSLEDVKVSVDTFLTFARENPDMDFAVTAVGTGLAGFTEEQIAPLFEGAPSNCDFYDDWNRT